MELMDAIYGRRAVRAYTSAPVGDDAMRTLLDAAIQAPSAMNAQPWAFAIVEDRALLRSLSDRAKAHLIEAYGNDPRMDRYWDVLSDPGFEIFYGAPALIVICAGEGGLVPAEDCCLAGENLMLAAFDLGLGTCCIGWARPVLNLPQTKAELGIPAELSPVLPIIVGHPRMRPVAPPRHRPRIVARL
jgi:nitroreductase